MANSLVLSSSPGDMTCYVIGAGHSKTKFCDIVSIFNLLFGNSFRNFSLLSLTFDNFLTFKPVYK
mgnify:CR=1 FL=1